MSSSDSNEIATAPPEAKPKRGAKFLCSYAGFLLACLLATAALFEIGVRVFVPDRYWRFRTLMDDWQADSELGWVNKPNLDVESRSDGRTVVRFRTNKDGLQPASAKESKDPGRRRVMLVGDSTVVGRAVPEDQRLAPQLERALSGRGLSWEVICAGVQGYSTDQELLLMRRLMPRYHPDLVIQMVCDNDFGGNESQTAYGLAKPWFTVDAGGAMTFHAPAATRLLVPGKAAGVHGLRGVLQRSAVYRLVQPGLQRLRAGSDWRQKNLLGVEESNIAEGYLARVNWDLFESLLAAMKSTCDQNGAALVVTQHPSRAEVWGDPKPEQKRYLLQEQLQKRVEKLGLNFCPVIGYFLQAHQEGPFHIPPVNPHCNGKGYEVTARCLAEYVADGRLVGRVGKQ